MEETIFKNRWVYQLILIACGELWQILIQIKALFSFSDSNSYWYSLRLGLLTVLALLFIHTVLGVFLFKKTKHKLIFPFSIAEEDLFSQIFDKNVTSISSSKIIHNNIIVKLTFRCTLFLVTPLVHKTDSSKK